MPVARFQMPDGRIGRFEVPDGTTPEQAQAMIAQSLGGQQGAPAAPAEDPERAARIAARTQEIQAEDRKRYDPTAGMSGTDKFMAGVGKAFSDTGRGVAQLVGRGLDAVSTPQAVGGGQPAPLSQRLGLPQYSDVEEARQLDAPLMDTGAGFAGNVGGNIAAMLVPGGALKGVATGVGALQAARAGNTAAQILRAAPQAGSVLNRAGQAMLAPTTLRGAAALGAGTGAIQPVVSEGERGMNALLGAGAGAGGQAAVNALARVVRPNTSAAVQKLLDAGVNPTPGQLLGGQAKRVEEALNWVPGVREGQRRAVEQFNTAAINRALAPVGVKLPKGSAGYEAIEQAERILSDKYDALMPSLTTQADGQFIQDIQQLRNTMPRAAIDPKIPEMFERVLNDQVLAKFQGPNATMLGRTLKEVESDLGQLWRRYQRSEDPDILHLGNAIRETQDILRRTVERSNPHAAKELKAINTGFAMMERPATAAGYRGSKEGVFSPAALGSAVKAGDKSARKKQNRRGRALMQDLSRAGEEVLGNTVPDSGTPFRALMALIATGGAGGLGGIPAAAAMLAAPAVYSKPGQNLAATLLARRKPGAVPIANALREIAPYAAVPAVGYQQQ